VFSNFKRWALGTYHGIRDKHIDIYANEFVFRWNRRRRFQSNIDTMLGLGRKIGRVTWRDVVGDTTQWKFDHADEVLGMVRKDRLKLAQQYAFENRCDIFQALAEIRSKEIRKLYPKKRPIRPALPRRRPGEERLTGRRYIHAPSLLPHDFDDKFLLLPAGSKLANPRLKTPLLA
jgi:hypothetical protein